jgi:hypothetical protein
MKNLFSAGKQSTYIRGSMPQAMASAGVRLPALGSVLVTFGEYLNAFQATTVVTMYDGASHRTCLELYGASRCGGSKIAKRNCRHIADSVIGPRPTVYTLTGMPILRLLCKL